MTFKKETLLYWWPRLSSLIISYIGYAFLIESTNSTNGIKIMLAVVFGLLSTWFIAARNKQKNNNYLSPNLPLGLWLSFFLYFSMGEFRPGFDLFRFVFLSAVASIPVLISSFAWKNPAGGGIIYLGLAVAYFLIGYHQVASTVLIVIVVFLLQTGLFFIYEKYPLLQRIKHPN